MLNAVLSTDKQNTKKVVLQRTGSQVWYYQFTEGKGIRWSVDLIEELNCWNMQMVQRIFNNRIGSRLI